MGVQIISGYAVNSDTMNIAREIAGRCGKSGIVEPCDLEGTSIEVNGEQEQLNYENLQAKKTEYGLEGPGLTPADLAVYLQQEARGGQLVVRAGNRLIRIQTLAVSDQESFDASSTVKALIADPKEEVPLRIAAHLESGGYTYQDNRKYLLPWLFYATKKGDCNDYALFAHYVLSKAGYSPRFFLMFNPQVLKGNELPESDDICAYSDQNGCWNYFDNTGLHKVEVSSIEQMFAMGLPNYRWNVELKVEDGRAIITEENTRKVENIRKKILLAAPNTR